MTDTIPTAVREPRRRSRLAWLLPLAALGVSAFLLSQGFGARGPLVEVRAVNGHGVRPGDAVRHLGIAVGEVEDVRLGPTLDHVELALRLAPEAAGLAREGTRFWIVRPHLALDSVSGLETVIGARYVAVLPGPDGGDRRDAFVALVDPPLEERIEPGGVEIVLEAPARFGLAPGAPLEYREVRVGTVLAVGLASDASSVEARAYVRPEYVELVREGSRFWESGGFELELGITSGLRVDLTSLQAMLVGGVRFATPPNAGAVVRTGHRFTLADGPQDEWLAWRPNVPVGSTSLARGAPLPALVRARLAWREGRVLRSREERSGWLVRTAEGFLGPADLLGVPEGAREGTTRLEVDGVEYALAELGAAVPLPGGLARLGVGGDPGAPALDARALTVAEDVVLVRDSVLESLALDAARLAPLTGDEGAGGASLFAVEAEAGLDSGWHGALALGRVDGRAVGVLRVEGERTVLAPLP